MQDLTNEPNQTQSSEQAEQVEHPEHTEHAEHAEHAEQAAHHETQKRPNRLRACIACRATKTRCIPSENRDACKSCHKHSRECVMPGPPKPRMRTRHKFSELERKVQLLTDALASRDVSHQNDLHDGGSSDDALYAFRRNGGGDAREMSQSTHSTQSPDAPGMLHSSPKDDVLWWDIDSPAASMLLNHWNLQVRPFLPVCSSPSDDNLNLLRSTKPLLFLAILTVASLSLLPATSSQLIKHLNEELARHIYVDGRQSIDLVQALLLSSHYFAPPENSTNFPFIQHAYTASSMAFDLSLNRQARSPSGLPDIKRAEAARTWLAVYYTMSISATLLRRQRLVFDGMETISIMADLLDSASATASDRSLCSLVRLQTIVEDASMTIGQISYDKGTEFDEPRTQYQLIALHQRLDKWKESVSEDPDSPFMSHAYHSARLYIYQIAIKAYLCRIFSANKESGDAMHDPNFSLSALHIDALGICLESSQKVFEAFTSLDLTIIRCLPSFYLVWNLFAAVCMVKMAPYVQHQQKSRLSGTAAEQGVYGLHSIMQLLDGVEKKLEMACQNNYMPHGGPFVTAFKKLRFWYLQKAAVCLNSRQKCDHGDSSEVHNLLEHEPDKVSRPLGENSTSSSTAADLNVVLSSPNDAMDQHSISTQGPQQGEDSSTTNNVWTPGLSATPNPFSFPIEASQLDGVFDPAIDPNSSQTFMNSDYTENQFDESMFTLNEEWLRGLLGLDGML